MFYIEQGDKILQFEQTKEQLEILISFAPQYAGLEIKESPVDIVEFEGAFYFADDEEYLAKVAQKEAERIARLSLTRGDVFRGLLLARGVTRLQLRGMIEANELLTEVQKEMALIDFDEALNFYRGNALIDTVGLALGIDPAQLDCFFQTNDYTCLLPKVEPEVEDENNETESNTDEPTDVQV